MPQAGTGTGVVRPWLTAIPAAVASWQLGSFGVVLETFVSGVSELPFASLVLLMQPIHLVIGLVGGLVTLLATAIGWALRARQRANSPAS
jgi:cobalt/nickel transport system permease protein